MTSSQRILVNTTAQYIRTVINVCLSLYSTRLILAALGQSDFGLYSVVAGIVAMLSFITNALVSTTQRYLSFNHGRQDKEKVYQVFGDSVWLHIIIALGLLIILLAISYPTIYSFLNIETGRHNAAFAVYGAATIMLFFAILTAPFRALFIARENIVYISVIDVLDGVFRLLIAIMLTRIPYDRLTSYALLQIGISIFNFCAFALYAFKHFEECHIPSIRELNREHIKELSKFAGWNVYGTGCVIIRNQGLAVVLNIFCGTIINAAYGIAQQVSGAVAFISSSIINAINPQIMKAEGAGDRTRMLSLSERVSKYALLLLSLVAIPLIFEMDNVLQVWLTEVPIYTVGFCQLILLASMCDQLTVGLTSANQAIGDIKRYVLCFYTYKLFTLLAIAICLYFGIDPVISLWCYVIIELTGSALRLILLKHQAGLNIMHFSQEIFRRTAAPISTMVLISYLCTEYMEIPYRFLVTITLTIIGGIIMIWLTSLDSIEKNIIRNILNQKND